MLLPAMAPNRRRPRQSEDNSAGAAVTGPAVSEHRTQIISAYREKLRSVSLEDGESEGGRSRALSQTQSPSSRRALPLSTKKRHQREQEAEAKVLADKWWEREPSIAGEQCSPTQARLCNPTTFTGMYKRRFEGRHSFTCVSGDYIDEPREAMRMLQGTTYHDLTIPKRAADFKTEVQWRMILRNELEDPMSPVKLPVSRRSLSPTGRAGRARGEFARDYNEGSGFRMQKLH